LARQASASSSDELAEIQVSPRPTLSTLDRVAELLQAFVPERPSWKLQEIAHHLGWDKATSHRFLTKLVELRFLERDSDGNFSLGTFILDLSALYMSANPVRQRLARIMGEVRDKTGLTTQAGFLESGYVVIALSEEGNTLVKASASLGAHLPLHATAIGKVILAQLDDESLERVVGSELASFTSRTIVDRDQVLATVDSVKAAGFASAHGELGEGLEAVAVPIPRSIFGVPAGLGCSGPAELVADRAAVEQVLRQVVQDVRLT
jgi:DNA-binding IclR family transcriptional regulator